MAQYYRERFLAQRRLSRKIASKLEVNEILETLRAEVRALIPAAMEVCILLLDPEASQYTRPMQCQLYNTPVNCLSCKRFRPAVQNALTRRKGIAMMKTEPVVRRDGSKVEVGPEVAVPAYIDDELLAVVSMVCKPEMKFSGKDFLIMEDLAELVAHVVIRAKHHWEVTQEKLKISKMLSQMYQFVPQSVRTLVEENPEATSLDKERKDVTVLFLDLENYTGLSEALSQNEVNVMIESLFSRFVDPIQRNRGEINETAGDGLMIIFKEDEPPSNAQNAVKAAFDIHQQVLLYRRDLEGRYPPLTVNMGINSGHALVGMTRFTGSLSTRMTYTASGPVTNLAARLAGLAKGGDLLIGQETRELIDDLWPVYELGSVLIKGFEEPQTIYSLLKNPTV
jgi:class 3 adenylate cyclase